MTTDASEKERVDQVREVYGEVTEGEERARGEFRYIGRGDSEADFSVAPSRWCRDSRARTRQIFATEICNVYDVLREVPRYHRHLIRRSVRVDIRTLLWHEARFRAIREQVDSLLLGVVVIAFLAAVLVVPGVYASGDTWVGHVLSYVSNLVFGIVASALAMALLMASAIVLGAVAALATSRRKIVGFSRASREAIYDSDFTMFGAAIITVLIAYALTRDPVPQTSFDAGMESAAWGVYFFAIYVLIVAILSLFSALRSGRFRANYPDGRLVLGLTKYISKLSSAKSNIGAWDSFSRRRKHHKLASLASEYEQYWPRCVKTPGHPDSNETASRWARQVASALYGRQLPILLGTGTTREHREDLLTILAAFVEGDPRAFDRDVPDGEGFVVAAWHRIGRMALVLLVVAVAIAFILVGVLQPELPIKLAEWGWPDVVVQRLTLGEGIQPQLLTVAAGFIGLAAKLIAPNGSPPASGRSGRRIAGR